MNNIVLYCFQHPRVFELLPTQVTIKHLRGKKNKIRDEQTSFFLWVSRKSDGVEQ